MRIAKMVMSKMVMNPPELPITPPYPMHPAPMMALVTLMAQPTTLEVPPEGEEEESPFFFLREPPTSSPLIQFPPEWTRIG